MIIELKIDNVFEKNFEINLNKNNKIKYDFELDYNITKITFYLCSLNEKICYDEKLKYLKKVLSNNKEIRFNDNFTRKSGTSATFYQ